MRSLSLLVLSTVALAPAAFGRMHVQERQELHDQVLRSSVDVLEPRGGAAVVGIAASLPDAADNASNTAAIAKWAVESSSKSLVPHAGHNKRLIEARSLMASYLQSKRDKRATCHVKKTAKKIASSSKLKESHPAIRHKAHKAHKPKPHSHKTHKGSKKTHKASKKTHKHKKVHKPKSEPKKQTHKPAVVAASVPKGGSKDKSSSSPYSGASSALKGLVGFSASNCGSSRATSAAPNGAESWLNCGISSGGWTPPAGVTVDHLAVVSIEEALAKNSVWEPCRQYTKLFEKYGDANDLPPILLMAIALQESTCNSASSGDNGGAHGLMQITTDKCDGQSSSACASPDYNIRTAAKYLRTVIDDANGNVLKALGAYNGWFVGMTTGDATKAASSSCCECQQNLDYLYQMLNGWLLGNTGYEMGSIGNLDRCHNQS